jgi:sulfate transport system ATP-binding protein
MTIEVKNISKSYGASPVLRNIDLKINSGELVSLLGPSGSGKTTLLRIIAGIEDADPGSGAVVFDGEDVSDVDLGRRGIGFVFQSYALFKHLSVFENIAFGLRAKPRRNRPTEAQIKEKVQSLLELIQLGSFAQRYPSQLSARLMQLSGANCAAGCAICMTPSMSRRFSSPMIRKRRWKSRTAWR